MPANIVLLIARILFAIIFVMSGFGKLTNIAGTAAYFANYSLPAPTATTGRTQLRGLQRTGWTTNAPDSLTARSRMLLISPVRCWPCW